MDGNASGAVDAIGAVVQAAVAHDEMEVAAVQARDDDPAVLRPEPSIDLWRATFFVGSDERSCDVRRHPIARAASTLHCSRVASGLGWSSVTRGARPSVGMDEHALRARGGGGSGNPLLSRERAVRFTAIGPFARFPEEVLRFLAWRIPAGESQASLPVLAVVSVSAPHTMRTIGTLPETGAVTR